LPIVHPTYQANKRPVSNANEGTTGAHRAQILYGLIVVVVAVFMVRLFYLQVIQHDYYAKAALNYQLKEYAIPAERGIILAKNGSGVTPLVLNEVKYTLFADPVYVDQPELVADKITSVIGVDKQVLIEKLSTKDTRYVVLAKKLSKEQHEALAKLEIYGVGTREETYRTYPQGTLAAQLLGFVNDDGEGQYGVEQSLNDRLQGEPGELRAITDSKGIPLVSNPDNVLVEPSQGEKITLTIDIGLQQQTETILKSGLERAESQSGSVVIMNPNSGAIKAMANWPSYDPAAVGDVTDLSTLSNAAVTSPLEVGSIMKTLTAATALDQDVVAPDTAFYNNSFVMVGDRKITDVRNSTGTQTVETVLVNSLNTGAVWLLKQIGRGDINERARYTWYDYMTKHFFLGATTGIEQAGEEAGYIPSPEDNDEGINVTYANTAFGQGMSATAVQMAAAFSSIVNGGTYYQPYLLDQSEDKDGNIKVQSPVIRMQNSVSKETSEEMISLLEKVVRQNISSATRDGYRVGGKTGTAEYINPETGLYYTDKFHGTYLGFVGGDIPEYVIMVRVNDPKIPGFAGSAAAAPLFRDITNMLIDNFGVTPKE
jgi:cell division protein FtsI/penicillin-binding protein 2